MKTIYIVPLVLALAACSSDKDSVDLGDDNVGTTTQTLEDYAGSWDGYVEAFTFGSGSDRLRFSLDATGNGTIEFGDAPAIAPYSDPNVGYPTNEPFTERDFIPNYAEPREGYAYPVQGATVTNGRIKLGAWGADIIAEYCAAQTPTVAVGAYPVSYSCSPTGFGYGFDNGTCTDSANVPVDCGKVKTCIHGCACDASSCQARVGPRDELQVDGSLTTNGTELVGTLFLSPLPNAPRVTIRLTKQ